MELHDQIKAPHWLGAPVEEIARAGSPQVALARAMRIPLQPFLLNIRATMADTTTTVGPFSWSITGGVTGGVVENTRLWQFAILDRMVYSINQPQANPGAQLKPVGDYFFKLQSGIQATLVIDGAPRYSATSDYTPIESLLASMNEAWAYGWVLGYTQAAKMQFVPSALMTPPTTIVVTFRLWQALENSNTFVGMTDARAIEMLKNDFGCSFPDRGCRP